MERPRKDRKKERERRKTRRLFISIVKQVFFFKNGEKDREKAGRTAIEVSKQEEEMMQMHFDKISK